MAEIIDGIKVTGTAANNGVKYGFITDEIMGKVPVVLQHIPGEGRYEWVTDTSKMTVNAKTVLKTLITQMRVFADKIPTSGTRRIDITDKEAVKRFIIDQFFVLEDKTLLKNYICPASNGNRPIRVSINFTRDNILELQKRCVMNRTATEGGRELIELLADYYIELKKGADVKELIRKYLPKFRNKIINLGFEAPVKAPTKTQKGKAAKAKSKDLAKVKKTLRKTKKDIHLKNSGKRTVAAGAAQKAKSSAGKKVLTAAGKAAGRKAITSAGTKLVIGAVALGVAIKVANPLMTVYSFAADDSFPVGGDYYSDTSQFYRSRYTFEKFENACNLFISLYKPKTKKDWDKFYADPNIYIYTEFANDESVVSYKLINGVTTPVIKISKDLLRMRIEGYIEEKQIPIKIKTRYDSRRCH